MEPKKPLTTEAVAALYSTMEAWLSQLNSLRKGPGGAFKGDPRRVLELQRDINRVLELVIERGDPESAQYRLCQDIRDSLLKAQKPHAKHARRPRSKNHG